MGKKAWFITHDTYIDRRIYFFSEFFQKKGYEIKLFASAYYSALRILDREFIKRPMEEQVLREYNIFPGELDEEEIKQIKEIINKQREFYLKKGKWAKRVSKLRIRKEISKFYQIELIKDGYIIEYIQEKYILCYNSVTQSYFKIYPSEDYEEIKKIENVILANIYGLKRKYSYEGMEIEISDDRQQIFIYVPQNYKLYSYDKKNEKLIGYKSIVYESGNDIINNKEYNFQDFKSEIYEYTSIFKIVHDEFQKEIPDVVYIADLPTLPIGIMLKEVSGCKLIMDCHEWWYKQTQTFESKEINKMKLVNVYEEKLYPKCDLRITVGKNLAERMQQYYNCKFEIIYSCVSESLSPANCINKNFLQRKYGLPMGSKIVVFQGGMSTNRNLENLARCTKYLEKDCYLLLLVMGEYQEVFKKVLAEEGDSDRVIWGGWIPQKDLLKYTQNADLGVIPYVGTDDYSECWVPNKLMEFFEIQLPILYDYSMLEIDLVAGNNNVGVAANLRNPVEFGMKINEILHDEIKLNEIRNNYSRCKEMFSYRAQGKNFEILLRDYNVMQIQT